MFFISITDGPAYTLSDISDHRLYIGPPKHTMRGNGVIIHRIMGNIFISNGKPMLDVDKWLSSLSEEEQTEALFRIDEWTTKGSR